MVLFFIGVFCRVVVHRRSRLVWLGIDGTGWFTG